MHTWIFSYVCLEDSLKWACDTDIYICIVHLQVALLLEWPNEDAHCLDKFQHIKMFNYLWRVKRGEKDPWSDTSAARSASSWCTRSDFLNHFQLKFWNIVTSPNWRRRVRTSTDDHHQPTWGWYGLLGTEPVQSHCHPPIMIWKGHMAVQTAQNPPRATNLTTLMVDCIVKMHL